MSETQAPYGNTTAIGEGKPKYKVGDLVRFYEKHGTTRVEKILDIKENGDYVVERNGMLEYCIPEDAIIGLLKSVSDTPEPFTHSQFKQITEYMFKTYKEKNTIYGDSYITGVKRYGKTSALQILFQKFSRMENIIMKDIDAEEGLGDSILDMANYLIMTYMALKLEKPLKINK